MRRTDPLPGTPAQFPFTCPVCGNDGDPGARVFYRRRRPVHVECQGGQDEGGGDV